MKKAFWWGIGFIVVVALVWYFSSRPGKYDNFAQCLTDEGVKMYGAYWCPHCQAQKKLFGASWKFIDYIECATPGTDTPKPVCVVAGIKSYPTWEFGADRKVSGELTLEQLASFSGCELLSS